MGSSSRRGGIPPNGEGRRVPIRALAGVAAVCCGLLGAAIVLGQPRAAPASIVTPQLRDEPITPIPSPVVDHPERVALGESLFGDPRLSKSGERSCSSCHDVHTNGAGAATRDIGSDGLPLARNTLTVFNAALSFRLGWVGERASLQDEAERAIVDEEFMGQTWPELLRMVGEDAALVQRFWFVYGRAPDRAGVLDAIAAYERTLLTPDSRFDQWLRGDPYAITAAEAGGYRLFKSIGCASCHQGVNVGANLYEKAGVFTPLLKRPPELLRVPSLRNVATTPPYFDDGSAATLREAVARMARAQLGRRLTTAEVTAITGFLHTLTGNYRGKPLSAPP